MPKKDSRLLLAKFNDQMEKLYELLRAVEDIRLAPEVLEPDPVDLASVGLGGADGGKGKGPNSGNPDDARWSGEASRAGGFENLNQGINIDFGAATTKVVEKKEMPTWISESTVRTAEDQAEETAMGPSMGLVEQEETRPAEPNDEITNLLLRHERQKGAGGAVAGLGAGDSDNRSDDSDDGGMQDGVDGDGL